MSRAFRSSATEYKNDKLDLFANLRVRWIWWNMDQATADLFFPHDKKWIVDFRASKGIHLMDGTKLNVILDVFNLTDQLYWDRSDSPNPRRWVQLGLELSFK